MPIAPARAAAFDILLRVDQQGSYASELLHSGRLESLSQNDRALTTELVMGVLRWRSRLDEAIAAASDRPLAKLDPEVLTALRLAAYQLQHLTRVPAHAAINDSVELMKRAHKRSAAPFGNAVLRKIAATKIEPPPESHDWTAASLAAEFAHPQWLVERWMAEYGIERTQLICHHDLQIPNVAIRVDNPAAEQELEAEGVKLDRGALLASARIVTGGEITRTRALPETRACSFWMRLLNWWRRWSVPVRACWTAAPLLEARRRHWPRAIRPPKSLPPNCTRIALSCCANACAQRTFR